MNKCAGCNKCRREVQNRNTTVRLLLHSFIIAMLIFAALRVCGVTYFVQQYADISFSAAKTRIIMFLYFVVEGTLILKILTSFSTKQCIAWAVGYKLLQYCIAPGLVVVGVLLDCVYIVGLPLLHNQDKQKSLFKSAIFVVLVSLYQGIMMFGRYGQSIGGKQDAVWQILSTVDYKFFLATIYLGKEMHLMDNGCFLFWGKFDNFAKRIGRAIMKPFFRD